MYYNWVTAINGDTINSGFICLHRMIAKMLTKQMCLLLMVVFVVPGYGTPYEEGRNLVDKGQYKQAIEYYQKALLLLEKHGPGSVKMFNSYNSLGIAYNRLNEYFEAAKYFRLAIKTASSETPMNPSRYAIAYHNLGLAFSGQKKHQKSIKYLNVALNVRLEAFGKKHPDVIASYIALGVAHGDSAQYDQSIMYSHKARNIALEILQKNHPYIIRSANNLAWALAKQANQLFKADTLRRKQNRKKKQSGIINK